MDLGQMSVPEAYIFFRGLHTKIIIFIVMRRFKPLVGLA